MFVVAFLIVALILFVLAAAAWPVTERVHLGWLGLAFVTLATLFERGVF